MREKPIKTKIDIVCGMNLSAYTDNLEFSLDGRTYYFCDDICRDRFRRDPDRFQKEPLIRLHDVWKSFRNGDVRTDVIRGMDVHIWEGDFVAIVGPSGSGKSTALNLIGQLDRPTSGKIFHRGQDVSFLSEDERAKLRSKTFGFVFQQYNLIPWLTARENVTLPLVFSAQAVDDQKISESFRDIGLDGRMSHRPQELSGGEQQRTALLRALANDPEIILGDEPTGNLDSVTGKKILDILLELNKKKKKTLLIVTHDADIAEQADQVISFKDGCLVREHLANKRLYYK